MMDTRDNKSEIYNLMLACLSGIAGEQQKEQLAKALEEDIELRRDYVEYLMTYTLLHRRSGASVFIDDIKEPVLDEKLWESLAHEEKTAPVIEMPQEEGLQRELVQKVVYPPREKRRLSKFSIYFLVLNAAAVFFLILFLKLVPPKQSMEVATLADSIDAKWVDVTVPMEKGARLVTGSDQLILKEGYAELLFDNKAHVIVESPAEFRIVAEDRIGLTYGKVYATIPKEAIGFSVYTNNAKIIDMGTEFGVQVDKSSGDTQLHVLSGKTRLMTGRKENKINIEVSKGSAKKISGVNNRVSDIPCSQTKFARHINSRNQYIWRGENLSLASIVAGRDGFQKVGSLIGINPATGTYITSIVGNARTSKQLYTRVPDSEFIDGVFVPDGEQGPIPVTSAGHTFDCPNTSGIFTHEIAAYKGSLENQHTTIPPAVFKGKGYENYPIVVLHSNIGITFDLQSIRESLPDLNLKSFRAWGGVTEAISDLEKDQPDIDFWILVDGQIKYERKMITLDSEPISFNIEFAPQDRFLTLIVTDGLRVTDGKREFAYGNDFFYLIDPELGLTEWPQRP